MNDRAGRRHFATTRWSIVLAAGADPVSSGAHEALATLCEAYWYPLYGFLRGRGYAAPDAEDLTQAFFQRLLEKHSIRHADPARGRFRSFLLASLQHFAANVHASESALKRGGGIPISSLEFESAEGRFQLEPPCDETPERTFDRRWARGLLDRVIGQLRIEAVHNGKLSQFEALTPYLTGDRPQPNYAQTAAELGTSEGAIKVAVHRFAQELPRSRA